jgi:hypothetical protein
MRTVAVERPRSGAALQGLTVLHNNLQLTICSMDEMEDNAGENGGLRIRNLIQRQPIPFSQVLNSSLRSDLTW